jgi:hypothetical protein
MINYTKGGLDVETYMTVVVFCSIDKAAHQAEVFDLERNDVYEIVNHIVTELKRHKALREDVWIWTCKLCGVENPAGVRLTDSQSEIRGTLTTHPPLDIFLKLQAEGDLHTLVEISITEP